MKQLVDAPLTNNELSFIRELIQTSQLRRLYDPGLPRVEELRDLGNALTYLVEKLRALLGETVRLYLGDILDRIRNPEVKIKWNRRNNNCQVFCDSLISKAQFGPLVDPNAGLGDPLHLPYELRLST